MLRSFVRFACLAALLTVFGVPACADPDSDPASGATSSGELDRVTATLRFAGDFHEAVDGQLRVGNLAKIQYDGARLTTCRGERNGRPAWAITAHYRFNGGEVRGFPLLGFEPAPGTLNPPIELTEAGDLEIWFENTSSFGCQGWDSARGRNYHFTVEPAAGEDPLLTMTAAFRTRLTGTLETGRTLRIDYAPSRLGACRGTKYGLPAWSIVAHYRVDGGAVRDLVVADGHDRGAVLPGIELDRPGDLEMWFENSDYWACHQWDSAFERNYHFRVVASPRAPGWMGNATYTLSRATCGGAACDSDRVPLENTFTFGTWARERAAIAAVEFDVWKAGVTDRDDPDLWRKLDVQVFARTRTDGESHSQYVRFERRVGNNARYVVELRGFDPFASPVAPTTREECPNVIMTELEGGLVRSEMELYFTVNGVPLRQANGRNFRGAFEQYKDRYAVCLAR